MKIKIGNKKFVYGTLRKNKADTLLIFLSGLSGGMDFPLFEKASAYFGQYDTFRIYLCNDVDFSKRDSYNLSEIDFAYYARALKKTLDFLNKDKHYKKIYLIGHSFGSVMSILFLKRYKSYRKTVRNIMWEPSLLPWQKKYINEDYMYDAETKLYTDKHTGDKINRKYFGQCIRTDSVRMFRALGLPSLIIAAKGSADKDAREYFKACKRFGGSKLVILDGTDHFFDGNSSQKDLFEYTKKYIVSMH